MVCFPWLRDYGCLVWDEGHVDVTTKVGQGTTSTKGHEPLRRREDQ